MKIINWIVNFIDKIINKGILIILIVLLFYSGYALFDAHATYQKAELSADVLKYKPEENELFSLAKIQEEINPDICGWIRIDNTNIDYPIVIGKDNTEYLNNDYRKEYSITGSIFLDYRNDRDFNDDYTIIYGHNLKKDLMFAQVKDYVDKDFFDAHSTGILYTGDKTYKIDILYFESINAYARAYSLMLCKNGDNATLISEFERNAANKNSNVEVTSQDKLILLSTCNSSDTETRSVLIGKLTETTTESTIINEKEDITLTEIDKQLSDREKYENVKEIIKDNEEVEKTNTKYIVYIIIAVILLIIVIVFFYLKREKQDQNRKIKTKADTKTNKNVKSKGKHMK